jgi:hypothetical protein
MSIILRKFTKFFEINIGWFFINGNKMEWWNRYINEKYFYKND